MAGSSTASTKLAQDGWRFVDATLDDLERLAAEELAESAFAERLLAQLSPLGLATAALWRRTNGSAEVIGKQRWSESVDSETLLSPAHKAEIDKRLDQGEPTWLDIGGERSLLAPWRAGNQTGGLQVWLAEPTNLAAETKFATLLSAVAETVARFYAREEQRQAQQRSEQSQRLAAFAHSVHHSLDLQATAFCLANEGRNFVGCERAAVAVRRGSGFQVLAVSGAGHIHRRADTVRHLESLCRQIAATKQPLWHCGAEEEDLAPQIAVPLAEYLDASPALALAIVPVLELEKPLSSGQPADAEAAPLKVMALLVLEQYQQPFAADARHRTEQLLPHARLALGHALSISVIPGHRWLLAWGRTARLATWYQRAALGGGVLAAVLVLLFLIPADVKVTARGELQPALRQEVFAPRDSVVTEVLVDHGQRVAQGEKLLELRSPELDLEQQRVEGELETTLKQLAAAQSERLQSRPGDSDSRLRQRRLAAEEDQLQQKVSGLEQQRTLLAKQREALTVTSPAAGEVITWNAQERLATRPLRRGDALLTIADESGPWQLELAVPSRRAGRLLAAWHKQPGGEPVSFVLTTDPGVKLQGAVKHVAQRVEIDEAGVASLRTIVAVPSEALPHRVPGATVAASITTSRGSLAEAWFYEALDTVQLWMQFGF